MRTARLAREIHAKPLYIQQLDKRLDTGAFRAWLVRHRVRTLNVAGPRESKCPGIYAKAATVLAKLYMSRLARKAGTS